MSQHPVSASLPDTLQTARASGPCARQSQTLPRPSARTLVQALAVAGLLSHLGWVPEVQAQTLPSGLSVVHGQAASVVNGNQMTVTNSANAVLNWQSFSVGAGNQVRFEQPSAASRVLNRVVGNEASQIFGQLSSNGQVWLLNPHGVLFGRDARVDVASLVASTLNLSLTDWVNGRNVLSMDSVGAVGSAPLVNQGELRAASGGRIWLVGGADGVRNEGLVSAPDGQVVLAAGHTVDLVDERLPHVAVRVSAPDAQAVNLGRVGGARVDLLASIVNQSGIVQAERLDGSGGDLRFTATKTLTLAADSRSQADGLQGGRVVMDAGASGTLLAGGVVSALGTEGAGGQVQLLGRHVGLAGASTVDASGSAGGGDILIGGGLQGRDPAVRNAEAVYFGPEATLRADATRAGDGGSIILWSDQATRAYGSLSARGGPEGGDGGFVETSGGWLDARPASVRTDAPQGNAGEWLLDPFDIYIVDFDPNSGGGEPGLPDYTSGSLSSQVWVVDIAAALLSSNVTITTGTSGGGQSGDIFMDVALSVGSLTAARSLTLNAARDIDLESAEIRNNSEQPLTVNLNAGRDIRLVDSSAFSDFDSGPLNVDLNASGSVYVDDSSLYAYGGALRARITAGGDVWLADASIGSLGSGGSTTIAAGGRIYASSGYSGISHYGGDSVTLSSPIFETANGAGLGVYTRGPVRIYTDSLLNRGVLDLATEASGAAIIMAGSGSPNISTFLNSGSLYLYPYDEGARWLLYLSDAATGIESLSPDFLQYGTTYPTAPVAAAGSGSGVLYASAAVLTVTNDTLLTKVYDATTALPSAEVALSISGLRSGHYYVDEEAFSGLSLEGYDTPNVGSDIPIGVSNIVLPEIFTSGGYGGPIPVYGYTISSSVRGDITPRPVTLISIEVTDKVYDGNRGVLAASAALGNIIPGQTLNVDVSGSLFDSANAGINKAVNGVAILADGSGLANNYQLIGSGAFSTTADITPRLVTLGEIVAASKVYDGNSEASLSSGGLNNLVDGEMLGVVLSAAQFNTPNVGIGKPVSGTVTLVDGLGGLASNYRLDGDGQFVTQADITPRTLTLSAVNAADKVYDGNTTAMVSGGSLSNLVAGQTLNVVLGAAQFDTPNVGTDKSVTGSATLANGVGGLASNYSLADAGQFATLADITPLTLTLSDVSAANKVYDGTVSTSVSGGALSGLVPGETLGLVLSNGRFDTADVGSTKPVSGEVVLADGSGRAANYLLSAGVFSATADITPRPISLSGVLTTDKVYDGTRDAQLFGGELANLVPGESLTLSYSAGLFDTADAGVNKPVLGLVSLGDATGRTINYSLQGGGAVTSTGTITPRLLTLQGVTAQDKVYDGTTAAVLGGGSLGNLVAGETLQLSFGPGQFDAAGAAAARVAQGVAQLLDGSGRAANYLLPDEGAVSAQAAVTPRPLTLSGVVAADKIYDGSRETLLSGGSLDNLVPGESLNLQLSVGLFDTADAGSGKPVTGSVGLLNGSGLAANYLLAAGPELALSATISPRELSVSGVAAASKVYDATTAAVLSGGQINNLVPGETLVLQLSPGVFESADIGLAKAVTGSATLADGTGRVGNYRLPESTVTARADISPASLRYMADPVTATQGRLPDSFSGQVVGFVAGESLATATTGSLVFTPEATNESLPGIYAIFGAGLSARNYLITQAPGNDTALTLVPQPPPSLAQEVSSVVEWLRPEPMRSFNADAPQQMRALDALRGLGTDRTRSGSFGPIEVGSYSRDGLTVLLAARENYKRSVFGTAMQRLANDPSLANLPPCVTTEEAAVGLCLVTEALLAQLPPDGPPPPPLTVPPPAAESPAQPTPPAPAPAPTPMQPESSPVAPPPPPVVASMPITAPPARPTVVATPKGPPLPQSRPVRTAAIPQIQRKLAVLIGLDNYIDDRIPLLENAGRDVEAVAQILETRLGYDTLVVRDASREAMVSVLNQLALSARPSDSVVVYFAGHGTVVEETRQGYWIPANANAERPETWISNTDIGRLLGNIRASQVVLISDSCFSGTLVGDRRVGVDRRNVDPQRLLQQRAAVVMSSGGNEPVADGQSNGHSPFAASLMQSLGQLESWRLGTDIYERIRTEVSRRLPQTPQYGVALQGRHTEGADFLFEQRQLETARP